MLHAFSCDWVVHIHLKVLLTLSEAARFNFWRNKIELYLYFLYCAYYAAIMCMSCKDLISEKKLSNNYIMIPIGIQPWQTLTEVYHYAGGFGLIN